MNCCCISYDQLKGWVEKLSLEADVYVPLPRGEKNYAFQVWDKKASLDPKNYLPTVNPPGKFLYPARERLFEYKADSDGIQLEVPLPGTKKIWFGIRACDLRGASLMDKALTNGVEDPQYKKHRELSSFILFKCPQPCDELAFCQSTGSLSAEEGADIVISPAGSKYYVLAKTERGRELFASLEQNVESADAKDLQPESHGEAFGRQISAPVQDLPGILEKTEKSPAWKKHTTRCFSCGTCNVVCPTCYCFAVHDEINLDARSGFRERKWDACMLPAFAEVAGDHNFRPRAEARQRHRVNRKFNYLKDRLGESVFCTGCGRCARQCTASIDIFDIVQDLVEEGGKQ